MQIHGGGYLTVIATIPRGPHILMLVIHPQEKLKQAEDSWEKEFECLRTTNSSSKGVLEQLTVDLATVKYNLGAKEAEVSLNPRAEQR